MSLYELNPISPKSVDDIDREWMTQIHNLGDDAAYLCSDVARMTDWCLKAIDSDEEYLWELRNTGTYNVSAIVELVNAKNAKDPSFKVLNIHLEPRLVLDYKESISRDDLVELAGVYTYTLANSFDTALKNGINKLKIFGRTGEMRSLFDVLVVESSKDEDARNIYRQGKWLIIE